MYFPNNITIYKKITLTVFIFILIIGFYSYNDYGSNIDDEFYHNNGIYYLNYLKGLFSTGKYTDQNLHFYKGVNMSMSPVLFDLILAFFADFFNIDNTKKFIELSHILNFIFFYVALIFFFKFIFLRFKNYFFSIISVLLLFLTPRFYAESFYNSRDIFYLSVNIYLLFFYSKFLIKKNFKNSLMLGIFIGINLASKIFSIIPFFLIFFTLLMDKNNNKKIFLLIFFILISSLIFLTLFWPYLLSNPIKNLFIAYSYQLNTLSQLNIYTLFMDKYVLSQNTNWYYYLTWIYITLPISILILFPIGLVFKISFFSKRLINLKNNENIWNDINSKIDFYIITVFIFSLYIASRFGSSKFSSWRHLYFLYPYIIIITIYTIKDFLFTFKKKFYYFFSILTIFIEITYLSHWNYKNHPYQYVYFNSNKKILNKSFDLDYWGMSNLNAIKYILKNTDENFKISTNSFTSLTATINMLDYNAKNKIIVTDYENADYIIDNHMKKIKDNFSIHKNNFYVYKNIIVDEQIINTIYKRK